MSISLISPQQLNERVQAGERVELIDVRTPVEFQEVHVTFAKNVPLNQLDSEKFLRERVDGNKPLYVICRSGSRGKIACEKILAAGCADVVNVDGGTMAWDQAGLPVARGRKVISLERQVRIAAGAIVVATALLSLVHHPYWVLLSGFIGAGLMFAGITDSCGMGMVLARMPWNQVSKSAGSSANEPWKNTPSPATPSCCG